MKAPLCLSLMVLSLAPAARAQSQKASVESHLDALFSSVAQEDAPGLAVLVRKDGRALFERGYGVRDLHTKTPIDPQTNFRLASFTKQFTAMTIMLLVHDGKLRYDQTLTKIFPEFPAYGKNVTVRNLLNHTGGLPDYEDLMDAAEKPKGSSIWSPEHQIQDDEVLALLEKESKGKSAPGTSWAYSNSGYVVLGLIVAKVSGQPYGDFLRARIFAPLGMKHTIVYQKGKNEVTNRAFGYSKEGDAFKETDQSPTSATLGDGGIYSNLEDLARWDDALRNHTLLSAAEMQPALTPAKLASGSPTLWPQAQASDDNLHPGKPVAYGFGWFLDPFGRHARMWHYGATTGFRTVIDRFTRDSLTIIILANRTDLDPEALALKTADTLLPVEH
ncbi:MAG TPA: serine hydrolase domain-containing protein [Candidatus Methylomirabilis sp.]|nr:serine hydrolase domain-containing protein [Candidatus Methylomirabilis sp.]